MAFKQAQGWQEFEIEYGILNIVAVSSDFVP
jgi:hypothetical protein